MYNTELYHHGIKGQKWGIRRYQNDDGTLTQAGHQRYHDDNGKTSDNNIKKKNNRLTRVKSHPTRIKNQYIMTT
jgi:hypothetical protein